MRQTRPFDIGVSVAYPLPNTGFYEKVKAEIGQKRNWTDSDDLCATFTAEYEDVFYRALRDALHAEVDSWRRRCRRTRIAGFWQRVYELEPISRNESPTRFRLQAEKQQELNHARFVPVRQIANRGEGGLNA